MDGEADGKTIRKCAPRPFKLAQIGKRHLPERQKLFKSSFSWHLKASMMEELQHG